MDEHDQRVDEHAVVIAGGGPTGLMLAAELALAGVRALIVERRHDHHVDGSRAGGLHSRTLEVLDQRGVVERFLSAGRSMQIVGYAGVPLDMSDAPTRFADGLALWQSRFEPILADWVLGELGVDILRGTEVLGLTQDDDCVSVELSDGSTLRAQYLVGCDGGRSTVRRSAGIDFVGLDPSTSWMIAEARTAEPPPVGMRPEGGGIGPVDPTDPDGPFRIVLKEQRIDHVDEPTLADLRDALDVTYGSDFGVHDPTWISRFTDMSRQSATYRRARVLLAGDAAHVHPPQGGQGLNTGVQDAVNLGWKLARVVQSTAPEALLDTYHAERHPVAARVLHNTMAQTALGAPGERPQALRDTVAELLAMDEPRRRFAAMLSGLDIHYDLPAGTAAAAAAETAGRPGHGPGHDEPAHPLVGRRMPDLDLRTDDGATRVFELLHDARPVLFHLGATDAVDAAGLVDGVGAAVAADASGASDAAAPRPADRSASTVAADLGVRTVAARHDGVWELPVIGPIDAPAAVLVRPDGHVAFAGDPAAPALVDALETWFGQGLGTIRA